MDRRIFLDYLRRYGWGLLITAISYACLATYQTVRHEYGSLFLLGYLALILCAWYFTADLHQQSVSRTVRTLPIEKTAHGRTLWFELIALSLLVGGSIVLLGMLAIYIVEINGLIAPYTEETVAPPEAIKSFFSDTTVVGRIPEYVCIALLLTGGYFLFLSVFRWWEIGPFRSAVYVILFVAYCAGCIYLANLWDSHRIIRALTVLGAAAMTIGSYRHAPRFLEGLSGNRVTPKDPVIPKRDLKGQETSIGWFDACSANPFTFVMLGSFSLVVLVGLAYGIVHGLSGSTDGPLRPTLFLFFAVQIVIVAFVVFAWSFLGSVRVFASLPISRVRLIMGCLVLPVIAFSPIAASTLFGTRIFLVAYIVGVGTCLTANAFYFRLNKMAALVAVNSTLVLLGFWPLLRTKAMNTGQTEAVAFIDSVGLSTASAAIVVAAIWTGWMLYYSNTPFRKKATLAMERFGGA